jgi:hypothetical protein
MKRPVDAVLARGLGGGILAGLVVAVWFLVVDLAQGRPFHTPAVLAHFFFQRETLDVTAELVGFYTVLHLGAFAALGVLTAWALAVLDTAPGLLRGAVFGVFVLDLVFYGALLISGDGIFGVLPWIHVLAANMAGGMALMTYLHRTSRDARPFGPAVLRGHPLLTDGIVTGMWGAAAVAAWFLAVDLAAGHPLRTPAALGAALFLGAQGTADLVVTAPLVAGYTVLHLAVFSACGVLFVAVARGLERAPQFALLVALACILLEALIMPAMALTAEWVLGMVGWWSVAVGNALAVGAMGWRVWRTHAGLRAMFQEPLRMRT